MFGSLLLLLFGAVQEIFAVKAVATVEMMMVVLVVQEQRLELGRLRSYYVSLTPTFNSTPSPATFLHHRKPINNGNISS